jgi:hypothetical protein
MVLKNTMFAKCSRGWWAVPIDYVLTCPAGSGSGVTSASCEPALITSVGTTQLTALLRGPACRLSVKCTVTSSATASVEE